MRPVWADPNEDFVELTERLYRLLDSSLQWQGGAAEPPTFSPAMDIVATDDQVVILAEVPGMSREQVSVQVEGPVITIAGERATSQAEGKALVRERPAGSFSRSFSLAYELDPEGVAAKMEDGLLRVSVPRRQTARIEVQEG